MELNRNIGAVIRQLRTARSMTQSDLADKAAITWRYLSDIEYGKRAVSIDVLERIAEVFHLKLSTLIARAEKYQMDSTNDTTVCQ